MVRAAGTHWKRELRRSVRLLLALGEPDAPQLLVEARLRLVERHLWEALLHAPPSQQPLAATLQQAKDMVSIAQTALISSEAMVEAILAEFSTEQAVNFVETTRIMQLNGGTSIG